MRLPAAATIKSFYATLLEKLFNENAKIVEQSSAIAVD